VDPRARELLNLELDDRLDAASRAELDALLAADDALRAHREQLHEVARALAAAPAPELPEGFRDSVLQQARWSQRSTGERTTRRRWRQGLALAASVVVAVVLLRVVDEPAGAPEHLAGTLAPAPASVAAERTAGGLRLTFDIPAGPAGEIVIQFAGGGERIVVPVAGAGRTIVQVAGNTGDFAATLVRDGVTTPIARQPTFSGVDGSSREP
jgi:anti-sigma factor RsiW